MEQTYLSIADAAELAGISRQTMGYHIDNGSVATVEIAGRRLITQTEAERFAGITRKRGPKPKEPAKA